MTIKRRLFWSNILMILVPVISTVLIGILCVGALWLLILNGAGFGLDDPEDFDHACMAISEMVRKRLEADRSLSSLGEMLAGNGMAVTVLLDGQSLYTYGTPDSGDVDLLAASDRLGASGTVASGGRSLYFQMAQIRGQDYKICVYGGNTHETSFEILEVGLAVSAVLLALTILISILLTNRFLTRFVFRRIEEPLEILTSGVHQIRDGNLDYRIAYDRQDEFAPICKDFNEMAGRLQDSVHRIQQQEESRKELIAGISHDIRSPLTAIKAYVEGLLDGVAKTPQVQRKYLETVKTKAEELNHIVSQLFLFSKMELGEYPENPQMIRLDEVITETVSTLREEYVQKGLSIETALEPACLYADPVQVERITVNILENSLKYKDKERGRVRILLRREDGGILLSFADDGPGVPPAALPHLFEVFYRSDPARGHPGKGSGLGLAIVANAVSRMDGTAEARIGELGGLEIRMRFPEGDEDGQNTDHRG